jgi:phospholipid transport system substrate-binding protein
MLNRRHFIILTGAFALALSFGLPAFAQSAADKASDFVKTTGNELVSIVNAPGNAQEKRHRLQQVVDRAVDVDTVARFCLGRYWRSATPEQQKQYMALFHDVLLNNITSKLGDYQGVKFQVLHAQDREDTQVVSTVVTRPNNPPTNVDWVVSQAKGGPKIIDVVAEGTSLRLTQRSDYASYLARNNNNLQSLIDAMRQQVAQSG